MLDSVEAVIRAVGGPAAAASLAGVRTSAVSNWKARGFIPPGKFITFSEALALSEKAADPAVFNPKRAALEARKRAARA